MTTPKEREQLGVLNGTAAPISSVWKREPTSIIPGSMPPTHRSGTNPYGGNPNRVGNPIATRILAMHEPPARKKVKLDHMFAHEHTTRIGNGNSSPDELNIGTSTTEGADYLSKYSFDKPSHGSTISIAPDRENTQWANKTYPNASNDSPMQNLAQSSQVKERIAEIEALKGNQPPRIDLQRQLKPKKVKEKMKNKDNKFSPRQQHSQQPSRSTLVKTNTLPLKILCLGTKYYSEKLEIQWLNDKITIKSDRTTIFGPFDIRANVEMLTYHDTPDPHIPHDPVFELKTIPGSGRFSTPVNGVSVKLDCSSPGVEESFYTGLLVWLKKNVNKTYLIRQGGREGFSYSLFQDATEPELSTKGEGSSKINRLDELRQGEPRRAKRSLGNDDRKPPQRSQLDLQDTSDLPVVPPRRSTRNMSTATRPPALDSDEVILVYPPGVPGAVNITNGDFQRLQPSEFLNDTLIEFGLKLWLKELEQTNPTLASQIHVFNSFFYKKLNHSKKGNVNLGYESVRKWTSKFDIFQKKYVIVPINENLHWYLAIICDPEYMLVPSPLNISPRRQTRKSIAEAIITHEPPNEMLITSRPVSTATSRNGKDEDKHSTPSEAEVDATLHDFQGSCSIIELGEGAEGERSPSVLSYVSDKPKLRPLSPSLSEVPASPTLSEPPPVDAASFYQPVQPKRDKGKRKADPEPESFAMEIDDDDDDKDAVSVQSDTPKTRIFTFDSLGTRHPQATKKLSGYLKMEAQDKKKIEDTGNAEGKTVLVPAQPNYCDCGLYLLHFAQTFMSNPEHYRRMILDPKSKSMPDPERKIVWHDHQVTEKRAELRARIMKLSSEWKKARAAKEVAPNGLNVEVIESSDSDIDILMSTPSTSKAKSGGRRKSGQAANRLRG